MINFDEQQMRRQAAEEGVTHFAVAMAVFDDERLLILRRVANDDYLPGYWDLPGGSVDDGESFEVAAARELLEETGLKAVEFVSAFEGFDFATPAKPKVRQLNFRVRVESGSVVLAPDEHDGYRWIARDQIDGLAVDEVLRGCLRRAF